MWSAITNLVAFEATWDFENKKTFSFIMSFAKLTFSVFGLAAALTTFGINLPYIDCDTHALLHNTPKSFVDDHCLTYGTYTYYINETHNNLTKSYDHPYEHVSWLLVTQGVSFIIPRLFLSYLENVQ